MTHVEKQEEPQIPEGDRCSRCKIAASESPHPCPFASEIHDDDQSLCDCCDECTHQCAMDI